MPKWFFWETIFEIWRHQCLFFMFFITEIYLTNIWRDNWRSVFDVVKGLHSSYPTLTWLVLLQKNYCVFSPLCSSFTFFLFSYRIFLNSFHIFLQTQYKKWEDYSNFWTFEIASWVYLLKIFCNRILVSNVKEKQI